MALKREDVIEAYEAIKASGIESPKHSEVREYLGRGSMTTINKYLKDYLEDKAVSERLARRLHQQAQAKGSAKHSSNKPSAALAMQGMVDLVISMEERIKALELEVSLLRSGDQGAIYGSIETSSVERPGPPVTTSEKKAGKQMIEEPASEEKTQRRNIL